jgi:hypothetical protein
LIAPNSDLGWLIEIERQLYSERRPRSKWHQSSPRPTFPADRLGSQIIEETNLVTKRGRSVSRNF